MFIASMPNIYTRDIDAAAAFYRDQVGFVQTYRFPRDADAQPEHVELRLSDSQIELVLFCEDLDRAVARRPTAGARVAVEPYDHKAGHRCAYVVDPDGNWLGLGES
jgi:lactoylglutathione lyase